MDSATRHQRLWFDIVNILHSTNCYEWMKNKKIWTEKHIEHTRPRDWNIMVCNWTILRDERTNRPQTDRMCRTQWYPIKHPKQYSPVCCKRGRVLTMTRQQLHIIMSDLSRDATATAAATARMVTMWGPTTRPSLDWSFSDSHLTPDKSLSSVKQGTFILWQSSFCL